MVVSNEIQIARKNSVTNMQKKLIILMKNF